MEDGLRSFLIFVAREQPIKPSRGQVICGDYLNATSFECSKIYSYSFFVVTLHFLSSISFDIIGRIALKFKSCIFER